jgi:peptidoglycan/LPS O-acetylase OafA/YrhL
VAEDTRPGAEATIEAIVRGARATRKKPSRRMWIAAAIVGIASVIGFVLLMVSDETAAPARPASPGSHAYGFAAGVLVGLVVGIAIGFAVARQRHSSSSSP